MAYFPLFIQLDGAACLVAGGGRVACRKSRVLAEFGAKVLVVAPEFCEELRRLAEGNGNICLISRQAVIQDARGMTLAVCATDDAGFNEELAAYCRKHRIPVNTADGSESGTFYFSSIVRQEDVVIGISTGGSSPAAAKYLRGYLEGLMPPFMGKLVRRLGSLRERIKDVVKDSQLREQLFTQLFYDGLVGEGELPEEILEKKLALSQNRKSLAESEGKQTAEGSCEQRTIKKENRVE